LTSEYDHIKTKDVREKLDSLLEEGKQNHTILILQNTKLQEKVEQYHKKTNKDIKADTEMNDYK